MYRLAMGVLGSHKIIVNNNFSKEGLSLLGFMPRYIK